MTDLAKADALRERMRASGVLGSWRKDSRPLTDADFRQVALPVLDWQAIMVEELAAQQGITPEKFMGDILSNGLYEAFLEFSTQRREAVRKQGEPGEA